MKKVSRREFFKKSVKQTLPILGLVLLASNPIMAKATLATDCKG